MAKATLLAEHEKTDAVPVRNTGNAQHTDVPNAADGVFLIKTNVLYLADGIPNKLPQFPEFKKLELSDKEKIEKITSQYPLYSDFNFTSLWSWDTNGERMISELNGNLVVKFTDYQTNEPFLSFFGTNKVDETIVALFEYAKASNLPFFLRLVPEGVAESGLDGGLEIEEDRNNFDYVYSINDLCEFKGQKFERKRTMVNQFLRKYPKVEVRTMNLADMNTQKMIYELVKVWTGNKEIHADGEGFENEFIALNRLISAFSDSEDLIVTGLFDKEELIGFSIEELLPDGNSICHFWKADIYHTGAYDFLMRESAKFLRARGALFLNYEQDLGVSSLRFAKNAFQPVGFLKKYTVRVSQTLNIGPQSPLQDVLVASATQNNVIVGL